MKHAELYRRYRPRLFKDIVGQAKAVGMLAKHLKKGDMPHALLLTGPSGCGKTTLARILRKKLGCSQMDYCEMNTADFRGIDTVREIRTRMHLAPIGGKSRVWLIDECHKLTGDAQNAILKMLEDPPDHVYFILATTDPHKLLATVKTRTTHIPLQAVPANDLEELIARVVAAEKEELDEETRGMIANLAGGSARQALVLLGQVLHLDDSTARRKFLANYEGTVPAINLCRALFRRAKWLEIAKLLKNLKVEEDPEMIRRLMLGYSRKVLLDGGKWAPRAFVLLTTFDEPFYDSGEAKLAMACYAVSTAD